jgi:hypothetical protein
MKMLCPQCGSALPPEAVNIATDLALCPGMRPTEPGFRVRRGRRHQPGRAAPAAARDLAPPGGREIILGTTRRSKAAWFLVPFTAVWSGGSMCGIYGTQIIKGARLLQSLFGIPFLIGTVLPGGIHPLYTLRTPGLAPGEDGGTVFDGVGRSDGASASPGRNLIRIRIDTIRNLRAQATSCSSWKAPHPRWKVSLPEREDRSSSSPTPSATTTGMATPQLITVAWVSTS